MSYETPLEETEYPLPESYRLDSEGEREYLVAAVVKDRKHKRLGRQYTVRYVNGQHQWWKATDVEKCFPLLLAAYKSSKSETKSTPTKSHAAKSLNKPPIPQPSTSTADDERKLRVRKRPSSALNEKNDALHDSREESQVDTLGNGLIINSSYSLQESPGHSKKQKENGYAVLSTSQLNDDTPLRNRKDYGVKSEICGEIDIPASPPPPLQSLMKDMVSDPINFFNSMAKLNAEFANQFVEPAVNQRKADQLEIESLKNRCQEAANENENLRLQLSEAETKMSSSREQHSKELSERHQNLENLKIQNERMANQFVETLRKIVGKDRYKDSDDLPTLTNLALKRIKELDSVLAAVRTPENIEFWKRNDKREEATRDANHHMENELAIANTIL